MKRVLLGALIAIGLIFLFDPRHGHARRRRLGRLWAKNKGSVLEAAGTAADVTRSATRQASEAATAAVVSGRGE